MARISEIRKKAQRKTSIFYDTFFTRPLSVFVTAALLPLGTSANFVSVLNLGNAILACLLIGLGDRTAVIVGVALVHLYAILDSVDGELARFRESTSFVGRFLEDYSAYFMINGVNLAVAGYLFREMNVVLPLYMAIGLAAFGRNAMPCARRVILASLSEEKASEGNRQRHEQKSLRKPLKTRLSFLKKMARFANEHLFYQTNMWVVLTSLLLVHVLTRISGGHALYFGTLFYFSGWILKELTILFLVTRDRYYVQEIECLNSSGSHSPVKEFSK